MFFFLSFHSSENPNLRLRSQKNYGHGCDMVKFGRAASFCPETAARHSLSAAVHAELIMFLVYTFVLSLAQLEFFGKRVVFWV